MFFSSSVDATLVDKVILRGKSIKSELWPLSGKSLLIEGLI
ncbi:hypothetical protein [Pontibacter toksunensis]